MGAVAVVYTLTTGGDLQKDLPNLAAGLDKVSAAAKAAREKVGELGAAGRERVNALGEGMLDSAEKAGALLEGVKALVEGIHGLLEANEDYAQATVRLGNELGILKDKVADAIGPQVASFINNFTVGLVYIASLVSGTVRPVFETLAGVVSGFFEAAVSGLEVWTKLARGDFAGARQSIADQRSELAGLLDTLKGGWTDIQEANQEAMKEAQRAWKLQVDGVKDTARDAKAAVTDLKKEVDLFVVGKSLTIDDLVPDSAVSGLEAQVLGVVEATIGTAMGKTNAAIEQVISEMGASLKAAGPSMLSGLGSGSVSGVLNVAGMGADPVTQAVMMLIDLLKNPQPIVDLFMEVLGVYLDMDEWISNLADILSNVIIENIPEMVAGFLVIGPAVALALIDAAPQLFAAVIDALFELPERFAAAAVGLIGQAADAINPFNDGPLLDSPKRLLDKLNPFNDRTMHGGGMVGQDGPHNLRRGELVLTPEQQMSRTYNSNIGGIHLHGVQDMRSLSEQLQLALGPYGLNLSLTPFVS